ncbi:MAG: beta-galactosidase [Candidatus Paceibacterota bacterium]
MIFVQKFFAVLLFVVLAFLAAFLLLAQEEKPGVITYGVSFNTLYARELGLDEKEVYRAILDDLGARHLRLAAHWDMVEPQDDAYNFSELDFQMNEAKERNADVILGVGRRLPRWPECHVPKWAEELSWEEQKEELRKYIDVVVNRYKDYDNLIYWQVENEPFLEVFAKEHCGELDKEFLDEEIALVRSLDPDTLILMTDSGNLGTWFGAYRRGDAFGTSVYVYLWNPDIGPFKSFLPPEYYRVKKNLMGLLFGEKPTFLIELSAEPWLLNPVLETPYEVQLERMNIEKLDEIIEFAKETRLSRQYLWGAEWWYLMMRDKGHPEFWERGKELFKEK